MKGKLTPKLYQTYIAFLRHNNEANERHISHHLATDLRSIDNSVAISVISITTQAADSDHHFGTRGLALFAACNVLFFIWDN